MRELKVGDKIKVISHVDFAGSDTLYNDLAIGTTFVITRIGGNEERLTYNFDAPTPNGGTESRYYLSTELNIAFKPVSSIKVFLNKSGKKYE